MKEKIDLSLISTEALERLKFNIKHELTKRKKLENKKSNKMLFDFLKSNDVSDTFKSILKFNGESLLRIPKLDVCAPSSHILYLPSLLAQDWSAMYPNTIDNGKFYVYAHVDPRSKSFIANLGGGGDYEGKPFYIGKGKGNRAFDLKRNQGHGKIIKELLFDGYDSFSIVKILFTNLSEQKALEIEAKLIYFFGIRYSKKRKGWLINLTEPPIPKFIGEMKTVSSIDAHMLFRARRLAAKYNTIK